MKNEGLPLKARHAEIKDIPGLKMLWKEAFGDEEAYIDLFFEKLFRPQDHVLFSGSNGEIVSSAALIPLTLCLNKGDRIKKWPVSYLYGMATAKETRGMGLGTRLLSFAAEYCRKRGDAGIATQPASQDLVSFYAKAGYLPAFSGIKNPDAYIEYDERFISFAEEAGFDVPPEEEKRKTPGLFLSFAADLKPENAYMAYPLD